mmetsp:Transcript_2555/g.2800  ORF Transcript_2555/g.2800 Transcript_2555/m.2800 type:complete len:319 (-) Transcript_2555:133-1089(-)
MRKIALVLTCLACAGHGREVDTEEKSTRRVALEGQPTALARLLLAVSNPSAAWQLPALGDLARRATQLPTIGISRGPLSVMGDGGATKGDETGDIEEDEVLDSEVLAELELMDKEEQEKKAMTTALILGGLYALGDAITIDAEQLGLALVLGAAAFLAATDESDGPTAQVRGFLGDMWQSGLTLASAADKELEVGWKLKAVTELATERALGVKTKVQDAASADDAPRDQESRRASAEASKQEAEEELRQALEAALPLKVPRDPAEGEREPAGIMERAVAMNTAEALREMREGKLCKRNFVRSRMLRLSGKNPFDARPR